MIRLVLSFVTLGTLVSTPGAFASDTDTAINKLMRGIAVKYVISRDRNIPKRDVRKWEASLSDYVDFARVNAGVRQQVRDAIAALEPVKNTPPITDDILKKFELHVLRHTLPRAIVSRTVGFLQYRDALGAPPACNDEYPPPPDDGDVGMCFRQSSETEYVIEFFSWNKNRKFGRMTFTRGETWRLSDVDVNLNERTLLTLARLK